MFNKSLFLLHEDLVFIYIQIAVSLITFVGACQSVLLEVKRNIFFFSRNCRKPAEGNPISERKTDQKHRGQSILDKRASKLVIEKAKNRINSTNAQP